MTAGFPLQTPAGTAVVAHATRDDAARAARAEGPAALALWVEQGRDRLGWPSGWLAVWVGATGREESPVCAGPTPEAAVAALFGEGDDALA